MDDRGSSDRSRKISSQSLRYPIAMEPPLDPHAISDSTRFNFSSEHMIRDEAHRRASSRSRNSARQSVRSIARQEESPRSTPARTAGDDQGREPIEDADVDQQ
jgi:hypothetical protein